jgi:predicted transcriptional regulator
MTKEQKNTIVSMRLSGYGYTAIARVLGLTKSAISNFCRANDLAGVRNIVEETQTNDLLLPESRGKLCGKKTAGAFENKGAKPRKKGCRVTYRFREEPDELAVEAALQILTTKR